MSRVEKLSIALTPKLAQDVRDAVASGEYASTSEVVREALRDWSGRRGGLTDQQLIEAWEIGLASGPPQPLDIEAFLQRNHRRLESLRGRTG